MVKKSYVKIISIFFIIFFCSGCVKFDGEVEIKNTKSMNLSITYAVDKNIINTDVVDDEDKKYLLSNGFTVKNYKKGSYDGISLRYQIKNIDKVSSNKNTKFSITSIKNTKIADVFKIEKGWFKNKYKANFIFDATDINNNISYDEENVEYLCSDGSVITVNGNTEIPEDCFYASKIEIENAKSSNPMSSEDLEKKISSDISLKFKVKLPNGFIKNNATKVSKNKKELTWKLKDSGITNINFSFELYNYFHIFITIIVCLIGLFILFVLLLFFKRKFRRIKVKLRRRR